MTLTIPHPGANRNRVSRGVLAGVAATLVAVGGYQVASNVGTDNPAPAVVVETQEPTTFGINADPNLVWPSTGGLPMLPETDVEAPQAPTASSDSTAGTTVGRPGSLVR